MQTWVLSTSGDTITQRIQVGNPTFQPVTPVTTPPLVLSAVHDTTDTQYWLITISGGVVGTDYAAVVQDGTTNNLLVVSVKDIVQDVVPYAVVNPEAYSDLVGELDVGQSAVGSGVFTFGPEVDASSGTVSWDLVDSNGKVWSSGLAYDYVTQSNGWSSTAIGHALITAPTDLVVTLDSQAYQLRWTLNVAGQKYYTFENIRINAPRTVPVGASNSVELRGTSAQVSIVTDALYDTVMLDVYWENDSMSSSVIATPGLPYQPVKSSGGWTYTANINTEFMEIPAIHPFSLMWRYSNAANPDFIQSERADLWVINPTISQACQDVKAKINKARTTLYGQPDLLFPYDTILTWMRRAADYFNTSYGVLTNITFTNPVGAFREFWLMITEMFAIEAQYLAEGEKAFDYQGAAISLSVDKTQYLDAMAAKIQGRLDNELKPFKQNMIIKGTQNGDGSGDPSKLQRGAMGSIGIAISPATPWYNYGSVPSRIYPRII